MAKHYDPHPFVWLTYELISPAILGAMIYEMFKPEQLDWKKSLDEKLAVSLRCVILIIFCMSWLYHRYVKHMNGLLKEAGRAGPKEKWPGFVWIDFFCPFFF